MRRIPGFLALLGGVALFQLSCQRANPEAHVEVVYVLGPGYDGGIRAGVVITTADTVDQAVLPTTDPQHGRTEVFYVTAKTGGRIVRAVDRAGFFGWASEDLTGFFDFPIPTLTVRTPTTQHSVSALSEEGVRRIKRLRDRLRALALEDAADRQR